MCNQDNSPALRLVKIVWEHGSRKSWSKLNGALQGAVRTAIEGGLEFSEGDFTHIFDNMRGGRWFIVDGHSRGEWMYRLACEENRNPSAWRSFEAWKGRKPFIVDGQRLYVGLWFEWQLQRVRVTSFAEDQSYVVACSYRTVRQQEGTRFEHATDEVVKIHKITHADIYAWNKLCRESEKQE